jgi:hypothetical protein
MQASQDFMALGALLADDFSVYIPDRRVRGLSMALQQTVELKRKQLSAN